MLRAGVPYGDAAALSDHGVNVLVVVADVLFPLLLPGMFARRLFVDIDIPRERRALEGG